MTTTFEDETFEDEVRAMLARRAADIPDAAPGSVPAMSTGLRIPLDPPRRDRRGAVLLAAAVIVLLFGAVGVVALTRADGDRERTGPADAPTRPTGPFPDIPGLPEGVGAEDLIPLWTDPAGPDRFGRESDGHSNGPLAFSRYLQVRFPDGAGSTSRNGEVDGFPDWYRTTFQLRAPGEGGPESDEATAYLWWSGESWSVMAVLSDLVTLDELVVDSERMVGSIYGDGPERAAAIGSPVWDLRLDRWQDSLRVVGENAGGDTGIVVDTALRPLPTTLLVAPLVVDTDPPPAFSEITFDPSELAAPGPATVPTIPDWGISSEDIEVVGVPVDAPLAVAVDAALPEGEELDAAQHRYEASGGMDLVELSSAVDGSGYEVTVFRSFSADEYETPWTQVPWGRIRGGGTEGQTSMAGESTDGVAVRVSSVDPEAPASHDVLLALVETLVHDPAVIAVANGADPAG